MKKALVIGIDDYPGAPLNGCGNDASSLVELLRTVVKIFESRHALFIDANLPIPIVILKKIV